MKPNSLQWEPIVDLERTIAFILHFFLKVELIFSSGERLIVIEIFVTTMGIGFSSNRNLL